MEILNINLGATETKQFQKGGAYIEILSSSGAIDIGLYGSNGSQSNSIKGGLSGMYLKARFGAIDITNTYGVAQIVQLLVCDAGEEGGSRRQPGIVSVVDGEKAKVLDGRCFRGVGQTGSISGASLELWNPVGSTKNLYVQAIRAGATAADAWGIQTTDFQLGTAAPNPSNLDRSGPASVALIRWGDVATLTNSKGMAAGYIAATQDVIVVLPRPIIVRPGFGCAFYLNAAANTLRATFEWEEWPV